MNLGKKLSAKHFILFNIFVLIFGLTFIFGLYYILNIQYQKSNNPFSDGPVTTAPKTLRLDLDHPDDEGLTHSSSIIVSGQTAPHKDVLIYTDSQDLVITSKKDGSFSTVLNLDEGVNRIVVAVFDATGDTRTAERTIFYSKEKI